jgi:hypothetical protein
MGEPLFAEIGWNDLVPNKAFLDTCATRMSYGLRQAADQLGAQRTLRFAPQ